MAISSPTALYALAIKLEQSAPSPVLSVVCV